MLAAKRTRDQQSFDQRRVQPRAQLQQLQNLMQNADVDPVQYDPQMQNQQQQYSTHNILLGRLTQLPSTKEERRGLLRTLGIVERAGFADQLVGVDLNARAVADNVFRFVVREALEHAPELADAITDALTRLDDPETVYFLDQILRGGAIDLTLVWPPGDPHGDREWFERSLRGYQIGRFIWLIRGGN